MQYFIANKMKKLNVVHRRTRLNKLRQNHATYAIAILSLLGITEEFGLEPKRKIAV